MRETYLKMFDDYLVDIKISKAEGTFKFYENHLLHIGRFMHDNNVSNIYKVDRNVIVEYLSILRNSVENSTINKRVGIIKRCFLFYGIDDHYIHTVPKFKEKRRSFNMINDVVLKQVIKYIADLPIYVGNNLMYKGIIFLLINTGVRLNELYNIEKRNVSIKQHEILLTKTKSGLDRVVYFLPGISDVVKLLLDDEHNKKYLLYNKLRNRPINYADINYLFKKIKDDLKIKKLHPHQFRHTYATKLLQNGVDIKTVMDFMGHLNMSTTQRYQHSSKEHAKKAYLNKYKY